MLVSPLEISASSLDSLLLPEYAEESSFRDEEMSRVLDCSPVPHTSVRSSYNYSRSLFDSIKCEEVSTTGSDVLDADGSVQLVLDVDMDAQTLGFNALVPITLFKGGKER